MQDDFYMMSLRRDYEYPYNKLKAKNAKRRNMELLPIYFNNTAMNVQL